MSIYSNNAFSLKLRMLRLEKGLTQVQLAEQLGITRGTVTNYEARRRYPTYENLVLIANFFGVSADYLISSSTDRNAKLREDEMKQVIFWLESINNYSDNINISALSFSSKIAMIEFYEFLNEKSEKMVNGF